MYGTHMNCDNNDLIYLWNIPFITTKRPSIYTTHYRMEDDILPEKERINPVIEYRKFRLCTVVRE